MRRASGLGALLPDATSVLDPCGQAACEWQADTRLHRLPCCRLRRPQRNNHAEPAARVPAPVVALDHFRRGVSLQVDWTKIVAQQSTDGNVALLLIIADGTREIGRSVGHHSNLPFAKFLGRRQVDIEEIWVTAA